MLKKLHLLCSYLIIALGIVHLGFIVFVYGEFTLWTYWFIGSGMAIVTAGCLNLAYLRYPKKDSFIWILSFITNLAFTGLFVFGLFLIGEPQVFVGIFLFSYASIATFLNK